MHEPFFSQFSRRFLLTAFAIFFFLPLLGLLALDRYYAYYENLAEQYECFPFEECKFDINGDNISDRIEISSEPKPEERYHERLRIWLRDGNTERVVLNLENVHVDGTFRTHLAILRENGFNKIVIYDTANPNQFFTWNGSELVPSENPSELEKTVRYALGIGDDTGGFHTRLILELGYFAAAGVYYFALAILVAIVLASRKRAKLGLP